MMFYCKKCKAPIGYKITLGQKIPQDLKFKKVNINTPAKEEICAECEVQNGK